MPKNRALSMVLYAVVSALLEAMVAQIGLRRPALAPIAVTFAAAYLVGAIYALGCMYCGRHPIAPWKHWDDIDRLDE